MRDRIWLSIEYGWCLDRGHCTVDRIFPLTATAAEIGEWVLAVRLAVSHEDIWRGRPVELPPETHISYTQTG